MRRDILICLLLAGMTVAVYWPVRHYGIIHYDDPLFTADNAMVKSGLNWHSFWWAMSSVVVANWHPVTSLSFVLDNQWFGANPGAEHVVNVLFHTASAVLLFLVLNRMTGLRRDDPQQPYDSPPGNANKTANAAIVATAPQAGATWRSAVVAAVFAWHPLRVESVAWISERKDVLCGFFMMLTLWAWVRYAQGRSRVEPSSLRFAAPGGRESSAGDDGLALDPRRWTLDYGLALAFFALGLMSKAMLGTVPFLLVLLDIWPLRRIQIQAATSFSSQCLRQFLPQLKISTGEKWPFFALSALFCGITFLVQKEFAAIVSFDRLTLGDRISNAITSYLEYMAKLFWPAKLAVIYPYSKSLNTMEVWLAALLLLAVSALCICQISRRPYLAVGWFWYLVAMLPVIGLVQVGSQAMADRYTYIPLIGPVIGLVWLAAESCQSRKILPAAVATILAACIGLTSRQLQFWQNTVTLFEHNVVVTPENSSAYFTLGLGLEHTGETNRAMVCYRVATAIFSGDIDARKNLANLLRQQGHFAAAEQEYDTLLASNPNDFATHLCLADVVSHLGRTDEAVSHLNEALRLKPDLTEALNNLAWTFATSPDTSIRDGKRAVQLAERACELTGYKKTIMVGTLAAAYAEAGRFDDAIAMAQKACTLASKSGEQDLLKRNQELLVLYRAHRPYHEMASPNPTEPSATNPPSGNTEKLVPAAL